MLENEYGNTRGYTTHGDIFPIHGARMTPINGRGGQRAFPSENRSKPSPQWNHYRIICNNGDISLAVNGKVVTQGKAASPRKGYICLESEGSPVQFRNLKIKELPSTKPKPEEIANEFTGFKSLYTGVDLSGWKGEGWKSSDWRLTSQDAKGSLFSTEKFSSYTFFADWRGGGASVPFKLPNVVDLGELAFPAGKWNRVQVTRLNGLLRIEINAKRIIEEKIDESGNLKPGPIELLPGGQFANIFVKAN